MTQTWPFVPDLAQRAREAHDGSSTLELNSAASLSENKTWSEIMDDINSVILKMRNLKYLIIKK